jgi:hypothetical protein
METLVASFPSMQWVGAVIISDCGHRVSDPSERVEDVLVVKIVQP